MDKCEMSVLMSVYNEQETHLRESIQSVLEQTFQDFEFIIVCDNPERDDLEDIIQDFSDNRIVLLQNKTNIGLAMCMNKAAEHSKSDLLVRMDADDVALPTRFEKEYQIMKEGSVDVIFTDFDYIDNISNRIIGMDHQFPICLEGHVPSKIIGQRPNLIHHPTVMMKRDILNKVGGYRDFPCAQDADLWYRMQEAGARFYLLNEKLLLYRINATSVSNSNFYLQQLTYHYINSLSVERLINGKDSFSKEHYRSFLLSHGYESKVKKKMFYTAFKLLEKAQQSSGLVKYVYRVMAFLISPQLRYNYLIGRKKVSLLNKYNS